MVRINSQYLQVNDCNDTSGQISTVGQTKFRDDNKGPRRERWSRRLNPVNIFSGRQLKTNRSNFRSDGRWIKGVAVEVSVTSANNDCRFI